MKTLVGYSTETEGYCVHGDGTTWGDHPPVDAPLLFIHDDENDTVTAVIGEITPDQQEAIQEGTLPWDGDVDGIVSGDSGDSALEVIAMLFEGP